MAQSIGDLAVILSLDAIAFTQGLDKQASKATAFAQTVSKTFAGISAATAIGGEVFGAGAGAFDWIKGGIDDLAELGRESARLGIETDKLSGLQFAAGRSGATMTTSLEHLNRSLAAVSAGSKEARDKFARFGLDGKAVADLGLEGALFKIADRFKDVNDGAFRAALAEDLMGRGAGELIPLLEKGSAGIKDLEAEAAKLGVLFKPEDVATAERAQRAMDDIGRAFKGLQQNIGVGIAPYITAAAKATLDWVKTLDIKAAVKEGFDWLESKIPLAIDGMAGFAKIVAFGVNQIVALGERASAVFDAFADPQKFKYLDETFRGIDLDVKIRLVDEKGVVDQWAKDAKVGVAAAVADAKGFADKAGAGGKGGGPGIDFGGEELVKKAVELPVGGLNIYEAYDAKIANLKAAFGDAADKSLVFKNAVADLNLELGKTEAGRVADIAKNAAAPLDKFKAQFAELEQLKMKGLIDEGQFAASVATDFKAAGGDLAPKIEHPAAALEGSDAAYESILNFQDQGKQGDTQERMAAAMERMEKQQMVAARVNQQIADAISRIFKKAT